MLEPSIHPKFWQTCGKLQLSYLLKFLCFKANFLELENTNLFHSDETPPERTEIRL